jgi:hypothetical protein
MLISDGDGDGNGGTETGWFAPEEAPEHPNVPAIVKMISESKTKLPTDFLF